MKLIIQVPCYNEEQTLGATLRDLPRSVPGFDEVEWLVIDDGSSDRTLEVAHAHQVDHIVSFPRNRGLASAFREGLAACLAAGADVIVNTDADNQYCAADIAGLVAPILEGRAEIVIGARPIREMAHFSRTKKLLQRLGSWVVKVVSGANVADAPSGFRALSREAALRVNVFSGYTYTLETIIQAGQKGMAVLSVPIRTNDAAGVSRPSRLLKSTPSYVLNSVVTVLRIFLTYQPLRFFLIFGSLPVAAGVALGVRYLVFLAGGTSRTHAPSLILAAILILIGFQLWVVGLVAELLAVNRQLLEDVQLRLRRRELGREDERVSRSREEPARRRQQRA